MSVGTSLRYYRGQFNPEAAYETQAADNGIISMYNPQQEAQYIDAIAQRQQRFDVTNSAVQAERARIGETETYDMAELTNRLKAFESNINSLVKDKYNGDYGAAANEIAKQIGTERTNPFYHFNKQKVESGKSYLDSKMKLGANFLTSGNPLEVSFKDWQNGKSFDFTPINRNDIVENSAAVFGTLANTLMNTPEPQMTADQKFMKVVVQNGLKDPQAVKQFLSQPEGQAMFQEVLNSMPELQGVTDQEAVIDAVSQGAYKAIGKTDVNFMQNPDYLDAYQKAQIGASSKDAGSGYFNVISNSGAINAPELGEDMSGVRSFSINPLDPRRMNSPDQTEMEKITETLTTVIKDLSFGDRPSEFVSFLDKKSSKNIKNMDATKRVSITDIAFDPKNPNIILGIRGIDKDGNVLESRLKLDAGKDKQEHQRILTILPYLERLGNRDEKDPENDSDFNKTLAAWIYQNYPSRFQK